MMVVEVRSFPREQKDVTAIQKSYSRSLIGCLVRTSWCDWETVDQHFNSEMSHAQHIIELKYFHTHSYYGYIGTTFNTGEVHIMLIAR